MKKVKIIFENKYQVVIDKPAGIMTHSDGRKDEETLVDWWKKYILGLTQALEFSPLLMGGVGGRAVGEAGREGVVHRLDTGTTGVMVMALTSESFNFLKKQFQNHTAKKIYQAIVLGHIKNETGIIDAPIARSRSDFRKKNVKDIFQNDGQGETRGREREAVTRYKVLARLKSKSGQAYTLVECYPETGRTHQLRVHLRSIRHPILGDSLYGVGDLEREKIQKDFKTKLTRPLLHAASLTLKILDEEKNILLKTFVAKMPGDMKKVLKELTPNPSLNIFFTKNMFREGKNTIPKTC